MTEPNETEQSPSPAEIEAALARVLSCNDTGFGARSRAFLQFIVGESLAGRAARLKAFTIAVEVFDRDSSFDPQTNSIVRVEATRLRRWLERYYATVGEGDAVAIRLPRGSYAPEFIRQGKPEREQATDPLPEIAEASLTEPAIDNAEPEVPDPVATVEADGPPERHPRWIGRRLALAGAFAVGMLSVLFLVAGHFGGVPQADDFPVGSIKVAHSAAAALRPSLSVVLDASAAGEGDRRLAAILQSSLEAALSRFDTLRVVGTDAPGKVDYRLVGNVVSLGAGHNSLLFRLSQSTTKTIVWSREFSDVASELRTDNLNALVHDLVISLAEPHGVIFADLRQRAAHGDLSPAMNCFVTAVADRPDLLPQGPDEARRCLGDIVRDDPMFAPAYARLAELDMAAYLLAGAVAGQSSPSLAQADAAARRAVELEPANASAQMALFEAELLEGKSEEAFRIAHQALALNPLDPDLLAHVGAAQVGQGDFDQGLPLLQQAVALDSASPAWIAFYYFLPAYMRGDMTAAREAILAGNVAAFPLGLIARILVESGRHEGEPLQHDIAELTAEYPGLARHPRDVLESFALARPIADRLASDLRLAGVGETGQAPSR